MIITKIEGERGCGYRKPGGIYLVGGSAFTACGLLPIALLVCKCCGQGIKPALGWTWVTREILNLESSDCAREKCGNCMASMFSDDRYGLIWVGEAFYKNPAAFMNESKMAGISRRIKSIPKGFEIGKTKVLLAHRKAITTFEDGKAIQTHGVFCVFAPERIEYVVKGDESPGDLDDLEKRGLTLVKVVRDIDTQKALTEQLSDFTVKYFNDGMKLEKVSAVDQKRARQIFKEAHPNFRVVSVK